MQSDNSEATVFDVVEISYHLHTKRGAPPDAPKTMRVDYRTGAKDWCFASEWVCFEHFGLPRQKAEQWWALRSDRPAPSSSAGAVEIAQRGELKEPTRIAVQTSEDDKFPRITPLQFAPAKRQKQAAATTATAFDDVPFDDLNDDIPF